MRIVAAALCSLLLFLIAQGSVAAGPALLIEPSTGLILYEEDADLPWRPASLTKLMTAYLTFQAIRDGKLSPEELLQCSPRAYGEPPSKLGLPIGAQLTVELAIKALIVKSANDVAIMLAEKIGGSEPAFVGMMNTTAKRLGMTSTVFVNPNGLPMVGPDGMGEAGPQAVTSARDMARLSSMILREFPEYAGLFAMTSVKIGNRFVSTHNSLLVNYEGADGMKTGFVCASGYNIVASATRNGRKLIAVVLGESSASGRAFRAAALFEHGFAIYPWKAVLAPTLDTSPPAVTAEGTEPANLRDVVCRVRASGSKQGKRPALKPGHRKPGSSKPRHTG